MILRAGMWGAAIGFFGGAILMVWILGFREAFSDGVLEYIKSCFQWSVFGFIFGVALRKWIVRTFWA